MAFVTLIREREAFILQRAPGRQGFAGVIEVIDDSLSAFIILQDGIKRVMIEEKFPALCEGFG